MFIFCRQLLVTDIYRAVVEYLCIYESLLYIPGTSFMKEITFYYFHFNHDSRIQVL